MNKRGQDLSIGTLILIVLGIVVLVILVIGFTTGWDFLISKFSIAPGQTLETVAQSCKFSGEQKLSLDYCAFKEVKIDGKNQYINCEDGRIEAANAGLDNPPVCKDLDSGYTVDEFCATKKPEVIVNNKACEELGKKAE
jgi:hypothetical protein